MKGLVVPKEVLDLAAKHLERLRPPTGWRWRLSEGRRVAAGWYFD
jgi:hypothetical protein